MCALALDPDVLRRYVEEYRALDRDVLVDRGLVLDPPEKGARTLGPAHR
ncbi:hypothetical protein [Streptomyces gobitricini]|uniref:Uncharacterized protein n=1 Tax=Streptomyces gobitricini TaxID=68211 RepID=A0ABP5YR15_9ACTN